MLRVVRIAASITVRPPSPRAWRQVAASDAAAPRGRGSGWRRWYHRASAALTSARATTAATRIRAVRPVASATRCATPAAAVSAKAKPRSTAATASKTQSISASTASPASPREDSPPPPRKPRKRGRCQAGPWQRERKEERRGSRGGRAASSPQSHTAPPQPAPGLLGHQADHGMWEEIVMTLEHVEHVEPGGVPYVVETQRGDSQKPLRQHAVESLVVDEVIAIHP